jgi:hypothetical protein
MPSKKMRAKRNKAGSRAHDRDPLEEVEVKEGNKLRDGCFFGHLYYVFLRGAQMSPMPPDVPHVRVYYEDRVFTSVLLPKLSAQIQRHAFQIDPKTLLEFVICFAKMTGSGFVTLPGPAFNYRPPLDMRTLRTEILQNLLRAERDMVRAVLEVVFCDQDTRANNSDAIQLIALEPTFYFNSGTGSRRFELTYLAADSDLDFVAEDVYRVTIQGTGWGTPNQFKFEASDQWMKSRFPRPVH